MNNGREAVLVRGLIALAAVLNLDVIAEGVESEAQLAALRELGCAQAQGYVFGKPFAAEELGEVLARFRVGSTGGV